MLKDWSRWR